MKFLSTCLLLLSSSLALAGGGGGSTFTKAFSCAVANRPDLSIEVNQNDNHFSGSTACFVNKSQACVSLVSREIGIMSYLKDYTFQSQLMNAVSGNAAYFVLTLNTDHLEDPARGFLYLYTKGQPSKSFSMVCVGKFH